ncbi:Ankyrin repeat-containing protein 39 [Elsinoe fawcettii]|nr:Ankyrin repeat-containing protein 39 [Elsinoe fawcettii]
MHDSRKLWKEAVDQLTPEVKARLEKAKGGRLNQVTAVLDLARDTCKDAKLKGLKLKLGDKTVFARDVLEKTVAAINRVKDVVDQAVAYDPAHAALPWAAFRLLLHGATNHHAKRAEVLCSLDITIRITVQYQVVEENYRRNDDTLAPELADALRELYVKILNALARALRFFDESRLKSWVKAPLRQVDEAFEKDIEQQETVVDRCLRQQDRQLLKDLQTKVTETLGISSTQQERHTRDEYHEMLAWVSSVNYKRIHDDFSSRRIKDTGSWLLAGQKYRQWKDSSAQSIYYLHGIVGSGKTILCSCVIDSLLAIQGSHVLVAYVYCASKERSDAVHSCLAILRSLARQLHTSLTTLGLNRFLLDRYEKRKNQQKVDGFELPEPTHTETIEFLVDALAYNPATLVIDGVDRIPRNERISLILAIKRISADARNVLKVFITSRTDEQTNVTLQADYTECVTAALTHHDVDRFASQQLKNLELKSEEQKKQIKEQLILEAEGMFLFMELRVVQIRGWLPDNDLLRKMQDRVQTWPRLYDDIVDSVLKQESNPDQRLAVQVLTWLLYSKEELTAGALKAACLAVLPKRDLEDETLLRVCRHLVDFDRQSPPRLRLIHHTAADHLRNHKSFVPRIGNRRLAIACLAKLSNPESGGPAFDMKAHINDYATIYWGYHSENSCFDDDQSELIEELDKFLLGEGKGTFAFSRWQRRVVEVRKLLAVHHEHGSDFLSILSTEKSRKTPVFVISRYNLHILLRDARLIKNFDWAERTEGGHTCLYLAAFKGHTEMVKILLDKNLDPKQETGRLGNAINAAAFYGHTSVVKQLLQGGATLERAGPFETPIHAGCAGQCEDLVLELLRHEQFDGLSASTIRSVRHAILQYGLFKAFKVLVDKGVDTTDEEESLLLEAVASGDIGGLERVMPPSKSLPASSLMIATINNRQPMAEYLLDRGADVNRVGTEGTPLICASAGGNLALVLLLLDRGADVNLPSASRSALCAASLGGHVRVVETLVHVGAKVSATGSDWGPALQAAAMGGHTGIVEILLSNGASVDQPGKYKSAFDAARHHGQNGVLRFLINKGFDPGSDFGPIPHSYKNGHGQKNTDLHHDQTDVMRAKSAGLLESGVAALFSSQGRSHPGMTAAARSMDRVMTMRTSHAYRMAYDPGHPFIVAAECGDRERVVRLFKCRHVLGLDDGLLRIVHHITSPPSESELRGYLDGKTYTKEEHKYWLEWAIDRDDSAAIDRLLRGFTDPEKRREMFSVAYHHVTCIGSRRKMEACSTVINFGVQNVEAGELGKSLRANDRDPYGEPWSDLVSYHGSDLLRLILAVPGNVHSEAHCRSLIEAICKKGNSAQFKVTLDRFPSSLIGADVLRDYALEHALRGNIDMFRVLLPVVVSPEDQMAVFEHLEDEERDSHHPGSFYSRYTSLTRRLVDQSLLLSAYAGCPSICRLVLRLGANPLAKSELSIKAASLSPDFIQHDSGGGCLHSISAIHACLAHNSISHRMRDSPLNWARPASKEAWSRAECLKLLIRTDEDLTGEGDFHPLLLACQYFETSVVRWLISRDVHVHDFGASIQEAIQICRRLAAKSLRQRETQYAPLKELAYAKYFMSDGYGGTIKYLLSLDSSIRTTEEDYTLILQCAIVAGDFEAIDTLLSRKAPTGKSPHYFGTPLQAASFHGHIEVVKALLQRGVDPSTASGPFGSALGAAAAGGHAEIAELLLGIVSSSAIEQISISPLQLALGYPITNEYYLRKGQTAGKVSTDIAALLLEAGTVVDIAKDTDDHVLILACATGDMKVLDLLLATSPGQSKPELVQGLPSVIKTCALLAAIDHGHLDIVPTLLNQGIDPLRSLPDDWESQMQPRIVGSLPSATSEQWTESDDRGIFSSGDESRCSSEAAPSDESEDADEVDPEDDSDWEDASEGDSGPDTTGESDSGLDITGESDSEQETTSESDGQEADDDETMDARDADIEQLAHRFQAERNPILLAVFRGHKSILATLLASSEELPTKIAHQSLQLAVCNDNIECVKILRGRVALSFDATISQRILRIAIESRHLHMLEYLLEWTAEAGTLTPAYKQSHLWRSTSSSRMSHSIKATRVAAIRLLLQFVEPDSRFLWDACIENLPEIATIAIERGVPVRQAHPTEPSPVHLAVLSGSLEVLQVLLAQDALAVISECEHESHLRVVLENLERRRRHIPLPEVHFDAASPHYQKLASVSSPTYSSLPNLKYAEGQRCWSLKEDVFGHLAEGGCPEAGELERFYGHLDRGLRFSNDLDDVMHREEIINLLLESGASANTNTGFLGTALHVATYLGLHGVVQNLIQHGADVKQGKGFHGSVLETAVKGGSAETVKAVLQALPRAARTNAEIVRLIWAMIKSIRPGVLDALLQRAQFRESDRHGVSPLSACILRLLARPQYSDHEREWPEVLTRKLDDIAVVDVMIDRAKQCALKTSSDDLVLAARLREGTEVSRIIAILELDIYLLMPEEAMVIILPLCKSDADPDLAFILEQERLDEETSVTQTMFAAAKNGKVLPSSPSSTAPSDPPPMFSSAATGALTTQRGLNTVHSHHSISLPSSLRSPPRSAPTLLPYPISLIHPMFCA